MDVTASTSVIIGDQRNYALTGYPAQQPDGSYLYPMPAYAGDRLLTNGTYYWRIQSMNPMRTSELSAASAFTVDLQMAPTGAAAIAGTIRYFGKVPVSNIIVEAYTSQGFGMTPEARVRPGGKGPYTIMGLRAGTYYVRAFVDQNNNKRLDNWESWGMLKNNGPLASDYLPKAVAVPGNAVNQDIVIRQDTDDDHSDA